LFFCSHHVMKRMVSCCYSSFTIKILIDKVVLTSKVQVGEYMREMLKNRRGK